MILSDLSVTRPVLAAVLALLMIAFGLVAFDRLPLREYPDIDPPVVSIETIYPGAAANVFAIEYLAFWISCRLKRIRQTSKK